MAYNSFLAVGEESKSDKGDVVGLGDIRVASLENVFNVSHAQARDFWYLLFKEEGIYVTL